MTKKKKVDVYKMVSDKIIASLEKGEVPWQRPWAVRGMAPANFNSKRKYTGMNSILLSMSGYACPYWMTYKGAEKLDGHVLKGEKGTEVVLWKVAKKKVRNEETGEMEEKKFFFLKYFNVFNLQQTSLADKWVAPELPGETKEPHDIFTEYVEREGIEVQFGGDRAYYNRGRDEIGMPSPEAFGEEAEFHSTAYHEAVHSTGHKKRLDRLDGGNPLDEEVSSGDAYSKEELVAEIGAAMLCNLTGVDTEKAFDNSVAYIKGWKKRIKDDTKLMMRAASQAQKAVDFIIPDEDEEEEE